MSNVAECAKTAAAARQSAAERQLAKAYRRWSEATQELQSMAHYIVSQFPEDRAARFLFAESLQAAGRWDTALDEYNKLAEGAAPNELQRIRQAMEQCAADGGYFPEVFARRVSTGEYAAGHNAQVWRDYARRDIQRGREIVRLLRQSKPLAGRRVLDVGSGYGGMLIAMAEQGASVVGVEIDPERASMGRLRLQELGMETEYHEADICAPGMAERMGTFDVVTCQDVLEHVLNPTQMIRTVCSMLAPGGIVYVQVPNKWWAQQLLSDHHYALTGITALSRKQAVEYWQLATGEDARHYSVGYPRGERYYVSAFARFGVELKHVQRYVGIDHLGWFARDITVLCERLNKEVYPGLRPALDVRIRRRIMTVLNLYSNASQVLVQWKGQKEIGEEACDQVVRRLCLPLWQFVGVKSS